MSKYGFDYFVSRGKKLNMIEEMARPVTLFSHISEELNSVYDQLMKQLLAKGIKDVGTRQVILFRYFIDTLNELGNLFTDEDGDLIPSLVIAKRLTGASGHAGVKKAVLDLFTQNKELASSNQFVQKLADPENLEYFKHLAGFSSDTGDTGSLRRRGKENELQSVTGQGIIDTQKMQSGINDIVSAMNKVMHGRNVKKAKLGDRYNAPVEESDPTLAFTSRLVSVLEQYLNLKQKLDSYDELPAGLSDKEEMIAEIPESEIERTFEMYEQMLDNKTGTTSEDLKKLIGKIQANPKAPKIFVQFLQTLLNDAEGYTSSQEDTSVGNAYPEYDRDVQAKFLADPETAELFDNWYQAKKKWRAAKNEKLEQLWLRQLMDIQFFQRKGIEDNPQDQHLNNSVMALHSKIQKYQDQLELTSDPTKQKFLQKNIDHLRGQIAQLQNPQKTEEEELMGYMTEQARKDSFSHKRTNILVEKKKKKEMPNWLK